MKIVVAPDKRAFYFGCWNEPGHYLHDHRGRTFYEPQEADQTLPWHIGHMDSGLLKNGKHHDVYDGRVFWTCGGTPIWIALFWWDRSVDKRGGSNSGFYVQGFDPWHAQDALDFTSSVFPKVISRQRQPLVLQDPVPPLPLLAQ